MQKQSLQTPLLLHGFLGCKEDWDVFSQYFEGLAINWFSEEDILAFAGRPVIGYSMGGRLALKLSANFSKVILISANLGTTVCRESRKIQDENWAKKLETLPLKCFLNEWYKQPLFNTLKNHPCFSKVLERRMKINPEKAAKMLRKYSVAKQPTYHVGNKNIFFIYGSEDPKYAQEYESLERSFSITNAGHAVHIEQPEELAKKIKEILHSSK